MAAGSRTRAWASGWMAILTRRRATTLWVRARLRGSDGLGGPVAAIYGHGLDIGEGRRWRRERSGPRFADGEPATHAARSQASLRGLPLNSAWTIRLAMMVRHHVPTASHHAKRQSQRSRSVYCKSTGVLRGDLHFVGCSSSRDRIILRFSISGRGPTTKVSEPCRVFVHCQYHGQLWVAVFLQSCVRAFCLSRRWWRV